MTDSKSMMLSNGDATLQHRKQATERGCPHPQQAASLKSVFDIFQGAEWPDIAAGEDTRAPRLA